MTRIGVTKNGRFPWALVVLAAGCTSVDPTGGLNLAGRVRRNAPELADAGQLADLGGAGLDGGGAAGLDEVGADLGGAGLDGGGADLGGAGPELPSSPTGRAYHQCAPRMAAEACGNAGRPELSYGRTADGFVCASCAPGVAVPCWIPPPQENGPYGLCRRVWLCVPSCRDCAKPVGPTCVSAP
jgi:hypothetical protein